MKTFNPLNISSKFAICGLPIRVDTYKTCSFGCKYCFSNNRKIMEFEKDLQIGNVESVKRRLNRIKTRGGEQNNLLDTLIEQGITWHCGGMSDPFQPIEKKYGITRQLINITKEYNISILFSTKTDNLYGAEIDNKLHSFQLSVTNIDNRTDLEPNVPSIEKRQKLYRELKDKGFRVGIRIQPFLPGISNFKIVEMFRDADMFTLEGIKIVPQNEEHKQYILNTLGLKSEDFKQMGLLNLKPQIRMKLYQPMIEKFEEYGMPYSIADNDMHHLGNQKCCCGDALIYKSTDFNNTSMVYLYGKNYAKEQIDEEIYNAGIRDCKCNHLFTSNRQEGCVSIQDFYDKRFYRKSSPFSPEFLYCENQKDEIIKALKI